MQRLSCCATLLVVLVGGALVNQAAAQDRDTAGSRPSERTSCGFAKPVPSAPSTFAGAADKDPAGGELEGYGGQLCAQIRQNFQPSVGAKVPGAVKLQPLPRPLVNEMQPLKRYTYVKFKHQVLLVNPMTRKIVDMFPES